MDYETRLIQGFEEGKPTMSTPLLSIEKLSLDFHTEHGLLHALRGVDLAVDRNEVVGLVGESGCGKTVLGLSVLGLNPTPSAKLLEGSRILFMGRNLAELTANEFTLVRGTGISMIFQEPMTSLNPIFTIGAQIAESIALRIQRERKENTSRISSSAIEQEVLDALKLVRIADPERVAHRYPHELSGGMKQRAMIAMALAAKPSLLIADEPTTALDVTIQAQILRLMRTLMREVQTSILFITHDLGVIAEIADRVAVMYAGQIVEEAKVRDLFNEPLHPYTQGLLASLPRISDLDKEIEQLPGSVPDALSPPEGCSFHPRCKHAMNQCSKTMPKLTQVRASHRVACHLYTE
jgi:oligopeptide/dipeptide ABC transporter ATP-binding protein